MCTVYSPFILVPSPGLNQWEQAPMSVFLNGPIESRLCKLKKSAGAAAAAEVTNKQKHTSFI